jgi:predicted MFS family arabinose efflux permease
MVPDMTAMTTTPQTPILADPALRATARPRLISRPLLLVLVAGFGTTTSFYLLLSVVPLYATSVGAGGVGAGMTTGALMLTTVAAELATPRLTGRFGHRSVLAVGTLLLGAPALVLAGSTGMAAILATCAVRGLGFAITVVVGSALVAALAPAERRGEALGVYGVVVGVPAVVALPLGVWLADRAGFGCVFVAGAVTALAGLAATPGLPGRDQGPDEALGVLAGLRTPALVRPAITFAGTAMAAGVVVTFLPLAVTDASGGIAATALLVQAAASTLARWYAGRYADRQGPARLLIPGALSAAAGVLGMVLTSSPTAVLAGAALFGAGFGVSQSASLTLMFDRVSPGGYGTASALWNLAYDAGFGVGAAGFGVVAAPVGYPAAFAVAAAAVLAVAAAGRGARLGNGREPSRAPDEPVAPVCQGGPDGTGEQ